MTTPSIGPNAMAFQHYIDSVIEPNRNINNVIESKRITSGKHLYLKIEDGRLTTDLSNSEASTFQEITDFVDKLLNNPRLSESDKKIILRGYSILTREFRETSHPYTDWFKSLFRDKQALFVKANNLLERELKEIQIPKDSNPERNKVITYLSRFIHHDMMINIMPNTILFADNKVQCTFRVPKLLPGEQDAMAFSRFQSNVHDDKILKDLDQVTSHSVEYTYLIITIPEPDWKSIANEDIPKSADPKTQKTINDLAKFFDSEVIRYLVPDGVTEEVINEKSTITFHFLMPHLQADERREEAEIRVKNGCKKLRRHLSTMSSLRDPIQARWPQFDGKTLVMCSIPKLEFDALLDPKSQKTFSAEQIIEKLNDSVPGTKWKKQDGEYTTTVLVNATTYQQGESDFRKSLPPKLSGATIVGTKRGMEEGIVQVSCNLTHAQAVAAFQAF